MKLIIIKALTTWLVFCAGAKFGQDFQRHRAFNAWALTVAVVLTYYVVTQ